MGFPGRAVLKNLPANTIDAIDMSLIPGSERFPGVAIYSGFLAWKIPWTEEPGRLQSMWSQRARHDWTLTHTQLCCTLYCLEHTLHVTDRQSIPIWWINEWIWESPEDVEWLKLSIWIRFFHRDQWENTQVSKNKKSKERKLKWQS